MTTTRLTRNQEAPLAHHALTTTRRTLDPLARTLTRNRLTPQRRRPRLRLKPKIGERTQKQRDLQQAIVHEDSFFRIPQSEPDLLSTGETWMGAASRRAAG
jgi:hypothetical protein